MVASNLHLRPHLERLQGFLALRCLARRLITGLGLALFISTAGRVGAQPTSDAVATAPAASRLTQSAIRDRLVGLLVEHARLSSPQPAGAFLGHGRMLELKSAVDGFLLNHATYNDPRECDRLSAEVIELAQTDRRTRRVRTPEDVLEIAANRIELRKTEAANLQAWNVAVERFLETHPIYRADAALLEAFDATVRVLGSDPRNDHRDASWFLNEADSWLRSKFPERF